MVIYFLVFGITSYFIQELYRGQSNFALQLEVLKKWLNDSIVQQYLLGRTPPKNMPTVTLTANAIPLLLSQVERVINVQVINLKKMKTSNRFACQLSDGHQKIRAYITDQKIKESDNLAFISITSYGVLSQEDKNVGQNKIVGVVVQAFQIIDRYTEVLGEPVDFKDVDKTVQVNKENKIQIVPEKLKSYIDKYGTQKKQQLKSANSAQNGHMNMNGNNNGHHSDIKSSNPILKTPSRERQQNKSLITESQGTKDYQKISDLYADFQNWKIVARLVKKNYRQFVSGKGKPTKVLNVEFMDVTGMKITGAMFGDYAKDYFNALKQDSIYQVSKGQIRQDQYSQSKSKNYSKCTIMFTRQSEFSLCKNSQLMPHNNSNLKDINYIVSNKTIGEQFDAVAILMSIGEQVQIPKENKVLYKQAIEICDPVNQIIMEGVIWNRHIKLESRLIGKTIALVGFRLNQYNDKLSLNSSYQSEVRILDDHQYKKYEGKVERQKMQIMSQKKDKATVQVQQPCKNLRELQTQLPYLQSGKQIRSTLTLILTYISPKKWYYQSCPHCRKSAQSHNRCSNCQKYVEQTIPRYKLNVELSDYCGSIWATGFEQLGSKLFADQHEGIKGIVAMDENERLRLLQKKQFQQFVVKVCTKNDRDGGIKHTVNRIYDGNIMAKVQDNIRRIKNHL